MTRRKVTLSRGKNLFLIGQIEFEVVKDPLGYVFLSALTTLATSVRDIAIWCNLLTCMFRRPMPHQCTACLLSKIPCR